MIAAHKAAEMTMVLFIPTDPRPDPAATSIAHRLRASIVAGKIPRKRKDSELTYYT